ncbi:hypothetical protein OPT61_g9945 [Boeremia exigua]|uniref:Uncharacterized protein n=1 Tax=Boeremia exigua TaxID=749465 RepID=A0ACC2HRX1_9PLEO|nr:hypothetical protein OPT61_g9945 [Boeremia exigua]
MWSADWASKTATSVAVTTRTRRLVYTYTTRPDTVTLASATTERRGDVAAPTSSTASGAGARATADDVLGARCRLLSITLPTAKRKVCAESLQGLTAGLRSLRLACLLCGTAVSWILSCPAALLASMFGERQQGLEASTWPSTSLTVVRTRAVLTGTLRWLLLHVADGGVLLQRHHGKGLLVNDNPQLQPANRTLRVASSACWRIRWQTLSSLGDVGMLRNVEVELPAGYCRRDSGVCNEMRAEKAALAILATDVVPQRVKPVWPAALQKQRNQQWSLQSSRVGRQHFKNQHQFWGKQPEPSERWMTRGHQLGSPAGVPEWLRRPGAHHVGSRRRSGTAL